MGYVRASPVEDCSEIAELELLVTAPLKVEPSVNVTVACWEPGQISPNHCHPHATEIYFCFEGGGTMRTPEETIAVVPGAFVVHPPGEVHEYENGSQRTLLFRVRYGSDIVSRHVTWRGHPGWTQSTEDADYYKKNPVRA